MATKGSRTSRPASERATGERITVDWLRDHLDDSDLRVIHVSRDRRTWPRGHIPGAAFANPGELTSADGREPDPDRIVAALRRWRVGDGDRIVLYDDRGADRWAESLMWLLRAAGFPADRIHVMEGGLNAWRKAEAPTTTEEREPDLADALRQPQPLGKADKAALERYREALEADSTTA
jgi:thiosulfate/3-mercaptopyruvate sulfurtransferase